MSDFIKYSPKRSPKAMTNAKWTATEEYRNNYDQAMKYEHTYSEGCKRPFCVGCEKEIIDRKMCSCGSTSWVYR